MQYYVYILKCSDNTFYTGITPDLVSRLEAHNGVKKGGAKYTRGRRPVYLVYYEILPSKVDALRREIEMKKLKRPQKIELITRYKP